MKHSDMDRLENSDIGRDPRFFSGWWVGVGILLIIITIMAWVTMGLISAAMAQSSNAQSNSGSNAAANVGVQAGAYAGGGNVVIEGSPSKSTTTYKGAYDVRNVPSVGAPGIITAFSCAQALSAGGAGLGWGASLGGTYTDKNCERLAEAAAVQAVAGNRAAVIHLARDPDMCQTFRASGVLPGNQTCTKEEQRAAEQQRAAAAQPVASSKGTVALLSKCQKTADGKVKIAYTSAGRANKEVAKRQCLTNLGY